MARDVTSCDRCQWQPAVENPGLHLHTLMWVGYVELATGKCVD